MRLAVAVALVVVLGMYVYICMAAAGGSAPGSSSSGAKGKAFWEPFIVKGWANDKPCFTTHVPRVKRQLTLGQALARHDASKALARHDASNAHPLVICISSDDEA